MSLSMAETERGWIEFHCSQDGFLVAGPSSASVMCRCGKRAQPVRNGRVLQKRDMKALQMGMSVSL